MLKELFAKQAELNKRTGFDPDALRADLTRTQLVFGLTITSQR